MTKLKSFVSKHDNLCAFLLFLIISIGFVFNNKIYGFDSLWVFGNLYKLSHGFKIYEEVNIITFPLFYEVFKTLLSLFNNYLGFLLLNFLILTPLYYMVYQVFKACNVKKHISLLFTIFISIITTQVGNFGPSYNTLSLLLYVTGLFFYLKKKDSKYSFIIQGIFAFLVLICNQKFGAAYVGGLLLLHLFNIKSEKKSIIKLFKTYLVTLILCGIFVLVLFLTGKLDSFINLTLCGMNSFSHNFNFDIISVLYILGIIPFSIFAFVCVKKKYNAYEPIKPLLCFSIALLIIVYPILNAYHFLLFFTVFFILVFYVLYNLFVKFTENKKINIAINIVITICVLFLIGNSIVKFVDWNSNRNKTEGDLFYGAIINDSFKPHTDELAEYIKELKEKNINYRILSAHAMLHTLYDVPEKNNHFLDMPLQGNLGKDDWRTLANELDQEPTGTYIIIDKKIDGRFFMYQFPEEVFNYVNNNYKHVKDFYLYSVYEK